MTAVRSYLAGTAASGALLLAAFVAFSAVTALVAFDGLPVGGDGDGADSVSIEASDTSAATAAAAAAAAGGAPAAVADAPAADVGAPGAGGGGDADGGGAGAGAVASAGAPGAPGTAPAPGVGPGSQTDVAPAPAPQASANPVDDAVASFDETVQDATGTNPNLGGATKPVTGTVDQVLQDVTGDDLGGHLENVLGPAGGRGALGVP